MPKEKDAKDIARDVPGMKRKRKAPPINFAEEKKRNTTLVASVIANKNKNILKTESIAAAPADP